MGAPWRPSLQERDTVTSGPSGYSVRDLTGAQTGWLPKGEVASSLLTSEADDVPAAGRPANCPLARLLTGRARSRRQ